MHQWKLCSKCSFSTCTSMGLKMEMLHFLYLMKLQNPTSLCKFSENYVLFSTFSRFTLKKRTLLVKICRKYNETEIPDVK